MDDFEPMRDYFYRRAAKKLNEAAAQVRVVPQYTVHARDRFVFPGTDTYASLERGGQRVGLLSYGINPLGDRLYINNLVVHSFCRRQGIALSALWILYQMHRLPIVPLHQSSASSLFWRHARMRFARTGAVIEAQIRYDQQHQAKQRWQHLVPELDPHVALGELKALPKKPIPPIPY